MPSYAAGARLPIPRARRAARARRSSRAAARRVNQAGDVDVRADLPTSTRTCGRVEGWIDDGTLGGEAPNAADLQIGASVRLLLTIEDIAARIDRRGRRPRSRGAGSRSFPGRVPRGRAAARVAARRRLSRRSDVQRRAREPDVLPRAEAGERVRRAAAAGHLEVRRELEQRDEHEAPRRHLARAGATAARSGRSPSPEQQQVDVDRARSVADAAGRAAELPLDGLARVEQRLGLEPGRARAGRR